MSNPIPIEKDDRRRRASPGMALDRALEEGWVIAPPGEQLENAAAAAGLRLVPAAPPSQIAAVEAVRASGSTAVEVAARLDISIEAAAMRLRRAADRELLERRWAWPAFIYYRKETP